MVNPPQRRNPIDGEANLPFLFFLSGNPLWGRLQPADRLQPVRPPARRLDPVLTPTAGEDGSGFQYPSTTTPSWHGLCGGKIAASQPA